MSTDLRLTIRSTSSDNTQKIAVQIGRLLRGGEVVDLNSDLGGGKTVFTKGLVAGAGSKDDVSSPTFTISKEYNAPKFTIYHFDFYRLGEAGIVGQELDEVIHEPKSVTIVEWSGIVSNVLPNRRLRVNIDILGENERMIEIVCPEELSYLLKGIKNANPYN